MKKVLFVFSLILIFALSGCSCSGKTQLSFSINHLTSEFNFSREYTVALVDNEPSGTFKKENAEVYGDIEMTGLYTVEFKKAKLDDVKSLVSEEFLSSFSNVYVYKTSLKLDAVYKKISDDVHKDFIETTTYFAGNSSLSPIYTSVESEMTYLGMANDKLNVSSLKAKYTTVYDKESYTLNKTTSGDYQIDESTSYSYTQNTVIDNGYLLFALENFPVEDEKTNSINVVSPVYGESKSLSVSCANVGALKVNNVDYKDVKQETFRLTSTSSGCVGGGDVGKNQIVYLTPDGSTRKIIRYLSPLTATDGSYSCLGTLIYELK